MVKALLIQKTEDPINIMYTASRTCYSEMDRCGYKK